MTISELSLNLIGYNTVLFFTKIETKLKLKINIGIKLRLVDTDTTMK